LQKNIIVSKAIDDKVVSPNQVFYLYDRYQSLDFGHAAPKFASEVSGEEAQYELAKLLSKDWLFGQVHSIYMINKIFNAFELKAGATFEDYMDAFRRWEGKGPKEQFESNAI
jgi:hypothetical protein